MNFQNIAPFFAMIIAQTYTLAQWFCLVFLANFVRFGGGNFLTKGAFLWQLHPKLNMFWNAGKDKFLLFL